MVKRFETPQRLIEQFLKFKGLSSIKTPSPVFVYKLYYPQHCMEFKSVKVPADINLSNEKDILDYIHKTLDDSLKIKSEIIVVDRFLNIHDKPYSLKKPPSKVFNANGFCKFNDFIEEMNKHKNLTLKNIDGTITLDTKI